MTKPNKRAIENRILPLAVLTPHARNYNRHGDAQIADLRESLRQFGQVRSVVVQADKAGKRFVIVAGHGIAQAAQAEGYTELRADVIPHSWSDTRVLAYLAADNELGKHADPDADQLAAIVRDVMAAEGEALARLAAGEQAALDAILNAGSATEETADAGELVDKAAELQKKWNVQRGDVWEIGRHRLMCGDSTNADDVAELMQGDSVEIILADPPYSSGGFQDGLKRGSSSIGTRGDEQIARDNLTSRGFLALIGRILGNLDADVCYMFTDWRMWSWTFDALESSGYPVRNMLIWDKEQMGMGFPWRNQHEIIAFSKRTPAKIMDGKCGNVLRSKRSGNKNHPTEKPVDVIVQLLENTSGAIVCDPFNGSGTTLVACEQTGRIGRGMEIEPKYCAVTLERMSMLGLTPKRLEHGKQDTIGQNTEKRQARQTSKQPRQSRAAVS